MSCDVVGFHIPRYTENFARAASCLLGVKKGPKIDVAPRFLKFGSALTEPSETPWLEYNGRKVKLVSSPVGTSPDVIQSLVVRDDVATLTKQIDEDTKKGRKLFFGCRVDYTKGNEELLLAFERLLERREDLEAKLF